MPTFSAEELKSVVDGGHVVVTDLNSRAEIIGADIPNWSGGERGRWFLRTEEGRSFPNPFAEGWETYSLNDQRDRAGFFGHGSHAGGDFVRRAAVVAGDAGQGLDLHALLARDQPAWSQCVQINNARQVCGFYSVAGSIGSDASEKGFVFNWETGELLFLADRGLGAPTGLSDTQLIIGGWGQSTSPAYVHDLRTSASRNDLNFQPIALSARGEWIVGHDTSFGPIRWRYGTPLNERQVLASDKHRVSAVNGRGHVVGYAAWGTGELPPYAVLYDEEGAHDLNQLVNGTDWYLTSAEGINDAGVIRALGIRPEHLEGPLRDWRRTESVILRPLPAVGRAPFLGFEQIFGGAALDGPGIGVIGGKPRPIPPWDPDHWRSVWEALNPAQQDILAGLGLSRYAEQVSDLHASQALSELSQKLIVDSTHKLTKLAKKSPRLALETRLLRREASTLSQKKTDEVMEESVLESDRRGDSPKE